MGSASTGENWIMIILRESSRDSTSNSGGQTKSQSATLLYLKISVMGILRKSNHNLNFKVLKRLKLNSLRRKF